MNQFSLEHQYQIYLKRIGLSEDKMHPEQKKQLRQTFMGACGQLLLLMRDEVSSFDEEKAVEIMQGMLQEVTNYFLDSKQSFN